MIIHDIPSLCLQYDKVASLLRIEWISTATVPQLRASAVRLLALLQQLPVRHLLIDMNSMPDLSVDDELWLSTHWMPGLVALPLEQIIVAIDSSQMHNQLAIDALYASVEPAIRFESHYFSDAASAMQWFGEGSDRLPALTAEWNARPGARSN